MVSCASAQETIYEIAFESNEGPIHIFNINKELKAVGLIDTGLSVCLVNNDLASKLSLTSKDDASLNYKFNSFGEGETYKFVGNLKIGTSDNSYARSLGCFTPSDLHGKSAAGQFFANSNVEILMGLDFFAGTNFFIDGPNDRIEITSIDPKIQDFENVQFGPAPQFENLFHRISINGEELTVVVDSGFSYPSGLAFFETATKKIEKGILAPLYDNTSFRNFSSKPVRRAVIGINFSPPEETDPIDSLIVYDGKGINGVQNKFLSDGFLGWQIMQAGVSSFNLIGPATEWSSNFSIITPPQNIYNLSGVENLQYTQDGFLKIVEFKRISPFKESGLKVGDVIVEINGLRVDSDEFKIETYMDICRGKFGLKIPMVILRDKKFLNKEIVLRRYLERSGNSYEYK